MLSFNIATLVVLKKANNKGKMMAVCRKKCKFAHEN